MKFVVVIKTNRSYYFFLYFFYFFFFFLLFTLFTFFTFLLIYFFTVLLLLVAVGRPFLFFTASAAAKAAEAALQYLQGVGIRTHDSATTDRCANNEQHSPLTHLHYYLHFHLSFFKFIQFCGRWWVVVRTATINYISGNKEKNMSENPD